MSDNIKPQLIKYKPSSIATALLGGFAFEPGVGIVLPPAPPKEIEIIRMEKPIWSATDFINCKKNSKDSKDKENNMRKNGMSFGEALERMRDSEVVARQKWHGEKGLNPEYTVAISWPTQGTKAYPSLTRFTPATEYIDHYTPTDGDLLAMDWYKVSE